MLEVGTSNAYSTIWLADAVRERGGRVTTLEADTGKIALPVGKGEEISCTLAQAAYTPR